MEEQNVSEDFCSLPPPPSQLPRLVYTHANANKAKRVQTFCTIPPLPGDKGYTTSIPEMRGKWVLFSSNGWFLLEDSNDFRNVSLWHPVSLRAIVLPRLDALGDGNIQRCLIISLPSPCHGDNVDDDITVILFGEIDNMGVAFSCRPGADNCKWVLRNTEIPGRSIKVLDVIACNGVIYGLARSNFNDGILDTPFITCDVADVAEYHAADRLPNVLIFRSLQCGCPPVDRFFQRRISYLVESCGRVFCIYRCHRMNSDDRRLVVYLWELNLSSMNWVRVQCLEDRVLFVGSNCRTWCWASADCDSGHIEGNCVYFADFDCRSVYLYKVGDCSLTLLSCQNLLWPAGNPTWVMPSYSRSLPRPCHKLSIWKPLPVEESCKGQKQNDVQDSLLLCKFPLDLLLLITKNLHPFDSLNFRASCKKLHSVVHPPRRRTNNALPFLMCFEHDDHLCRILCPSRNDSQFLVFSKSLEGPISIEFCKDGWLLIGTGDGSSLQFLNPFTRESLKCPSSQYILGFDSVGFSSCPTSSDCIIVGIQCGYFGTPIHYFKSGEERWTDLCFDKTDIKFEPDSSPVYYNGAFYFMDRKGYLGVFGFENGKGTWEVFKKPSTVNDYFHSIHLVECDGEILSIFIGNLGFWVQVFKLNQPKMNWREVKDLGDHLFFVSRPSSISMVSQHPQMRNRIYFPRLHKNDVLFYTLDTGKFDTLVGDGSINNFIYTTEFRNYCWI